MGLDGEIFAYSACLNITQAEMTSIATNISEQNAEPFLASGVWLSGQKYVCLRAMMDEGLIYAKLGPAGACIVKSEYCIVIGIYSKGMGGGECNVATEGLCKYLEEMGF